MRSITNLNKVSLFHFVTVTGMVAWTAILLGLYLWAANGEQEHFAETIELKGESLANHTDSIRQWIVEQGGVYVAINDKIEPHPLLAYLPERDIETPSGHKLTLLSAPSVLRHSSHFFESDGGDKIRLVSNMPMNPDNIPDDWEKEALKKLDSGAEKVQGFVSVGEESLFRLMLPMKLQPQCSNCHYYLKATMQKVVGGLSVTVDKAPYDRMSAEALHTLSAGYMGIWIIGLFGLAVFDFTGARLLRNIEFVATHDGLTGLNNRREIERLLDLECERADRYGSLLYVMMLDIDHFKRVNDIYGHPSGDEALRVVAETIRQTIRKTDIAGRYGGEEMLVLAPGIDYDGAKVLAQRLNTAIKNAPIRLKGGKSISVKVSIGAASYSPERKSPNSIVKSADDSLYQAKESGRDCTKFAPESLKESAPLNVKL
ncbi:MAG: diguanylate cyclase [Gammaproteobacteria bacterium]|nr:diguanylate cyclase [Gammaproteobacteria bacterium]